MNGLLGLEDEVARRVAAVQTLVRSCGRTLVAYSGGVDSSCLLALAHLAAPGQVAGVIADSPSLPRAALRRACEQAAAIGAELRVLPTREFDDPRYIANPPNRCFFCKAELFRRMEEMAQREGFETLAYGENAEDPPSQRPGAQAAAAFRVRAPLREAGMGKADVRRVAAALGLAVADAPAEPCLASRIAHGIEVTPGRVALIERAEARLRAELGFRILRVRLTGLHPLSALVQVGPAELPALEAAAVDVRRMVCEEGFEAVELDPLGYRGAGLL